MRLFIILTMLFLSDELLFSQDTITIFYNNFWKEVSDKSKAVYYRKAFKDSNNIWTANDYYISNKLQMTGTFKSKRLTDKNGHFIYYFENKNKESEGEFINNKREGLWTNWYENGQKKSEGKFINDKLGEKWEYWFDNGAKKSEGVYIYDFTEGTWTYWYDTGEKLAEGNFLHNNKNDTWKEFYKTGQTKSIEQYENGLLLNSTVYFENGTIKSTIIHKSKKNIDELSFWNIDGRLYMKGFFSKNGPTGRWVRYFQNGDSLVIDYNNMGFITGKNLGGIIKED